MKNLHTVLILFFGVFAFSFEEQPSSYDPMSGISYKDGVLFLFEKQKFMYVPDSYQLDTVFGTVTKVNSTDIFIKSHYQEKYISEVSYKFTQTSNRDSMFVTFNNYDKNYPTAFVGIDLVYHGSIIKLNGLDEKKRTVPKENLLNMKVTILGDIESELVTIKDSVLGDTLFIEFDYLTVREIPRYTFISDTLKDYK